MKIISRLRSVVKRLKMKKIAYGFKKYASKSWHWFRRLRGFKLVAFIVGLAIILAAGFYVVSLQGDKVTLVVYNANTGAKVDKSSFSLQDRIMVDVNFKRPLSENYSIDIVRSNTKQAPFRIEIPSAGAGHSRTIAIPAKLVVSGKYTFILKDSKNHKVLDQKNIVVKN